MDEVKIDKDIIKKLEYLIIVKENNNLKTHNLNDQQMINWIKKAIAEEIHVNKIDKA